MDISERKAFNKRAFVSVALLVSGMLLPVSGIMNHELQFAGLTTARHAWMSVHNMAATLFCLSAIAHIILNRRALLLYAHKAAGVMLSKEALAAAGLVVAIVGLFASHAFHVGVRTP